SFASGCCLPDLVTRSARSRAHPIENGGRGQGDGRRRREGGDTDSRFSSGVVRPARDGEELAEAVVPSIGDIQVPRAVDLKTGGIQELRIHGILSVPRRPEGHCACESAGPALLEVRIEQDPVYPAEAEGLRAEEE